MSINRTPNDFKTETGEGRIRYNGTYQGIIKDNKDVHKEGRLRVFIPELCGEPDDEKGWITVFYASSFGGASNIENNIENSGELSGTQTSYGWWAVPPDLDNHVLITFVMGDPSRGFWFACLFQNYMNHMVPGIPLNISTDDKVNAKNLPPVAEYNKKDPKGGAKDVLKPKRPVYTPLHDGLTQQGLYPDPERGASTSGARRDAPSTVYGFLSPNGNTFHIDDDPENGFIRLRTRNGVQVLVHDTTGYVYLNSKEGKSWIEVSDEGIDMYSMRSISMRAEENINMHANQNVIINGEAIHTRASNITQYSTGRIKTVAEGEIHTTSPRIFDNSTDEQAQADKQPETPSPTATVPKGSAGSSTATSVPDGGVTTPSGTDPGSNISWKLPVQYGKVNDVPGTPRDNGDRQHTGYDIGSYVGGSDTRVPIGGASVNPSADGVVTQVVSGIDGDGGGRRVVVQHADGTSTRYLHLGSVASGLSVGQTITSDASLGTVGGSGDTGDANYPAHLHYERLDTDGKIIAPFGDAALSAQMVSGSSFDNRPDQTVSSGQYGANTVTPPSTPISSAPSTKNGSAKGNTDTQTENQKLVKTKTPPIPVAKDDVVGTNGEYKATSTKTIVTRMPSHEPWTGHPKAIKADRTGYSAQNNPTPTVDEKGVASTISNNSTSSGVSRGQAVNSSVTQEGRALLDTVAGPSMQYGDNGYNTLSDGTTFSDYSQYPSGASSAGRYQLTQDQWDAQKQILGLNDFSPSSQDAAAWNIAKTIYNTKTNGDLQSTLRSGDALAMADAGNALKSQWASIPGGVTKTDNGITSTFATRYSANLSATQMMPELGNYGLGNVADIASASSVTPSAKPSGIYVPKK